MPFTPLGDRVVIQADVEDHAPEVTDGGVVLAKTLAAAVEGSDREDSWCVGTIVACGPLVRAFDARGYLTRRLRATVVGMATQTNGHIREGLSALMAEVAHLPAECADPLQVGDRVTFSWASGQQITVDGERFLIMPAREVLAVVLDEDNVITGDGPSPD